MEREYLKPIPPIKTGHGDDVLDKLSISVDYEKGGWSCFTGDINERGIYVYVTPTRIDTHEFKGHISHSRHTIITGNKRLSGFKVLVMPLNRKSTKALDIYYNKVGKVVDKVVEEFVNGNYANVAKLLMCC